MTRPIAFSLNVLRQWWGLGLVLVALTTALGAVAGLQSDLTTGVYFRVDPASEDSTRVTQGTQTAVKLIDSTDVYGAAAGPAGTTATALAQATTVAVVPSSELVSVSVRCAVAATCYRELDAIVAATQKSLSTTAADQFSAIAAGGVSALRSGALPDLDAERARRQELGQQTAQRQNGALAAGSSITLVGEPTPMTRAGLTPAVGATFGVLVGLVALAAAVLVLGGRAGRVRSARDWLLRRGSAQCVDRAGVAQLAHRLHADRIPLVLVLPAGDGSTDDTADVATSLQGELESEGAVTALVRITRTAATLVSNEGAAIARVPSPLARAPRSELLARCHADVAVAYCEGGVPPAGRVGTRVPATVFVAAGADASYRTLGRAFDSVSGTSYAVLA